MEDEQTGPMPGSRDKRIYLLQNHPDWFWGPPCLLLNGYGKRLDKMEGKFEH